MMHIKYAKVKHVRSSPWGDAKCLSANRVSQRYALGVNLNMDISLERLMFNWI